MKPYKSYMSLYKEGDKLNKFLFVFLVLQIIVLCLLNTTIAIPVAMAKSLSENHEADGLVLDYENIDFSFPNQLDIGHFTLKKDDHPVIKIDDLSFQGSIFGLPWRNLSKLEGFQAEEISLYSPLKNQPILSARGTRVQKNGSKEHFITSSISIDQKVLSIKGVLDLNYLQSLFVKKDPAKSGVGIDRLVTAIEKLDSLVRGTPPIRLQAYLRANANSMLCIAQSSPTQRSANQINGFCSILKISDEGNKIHSAAIRARVDAFSVKTGSLGATFQDISLTNDSIRLKNLKVLKDGVGEINLHIGKIKFDGKMQGHLPRFNIVSKSTDKLEEGMFFSDSNSTRIALSYLYTSSLSLNGEAEFTPKNFDLYCDTKKGRLKVLGGDKVNAYALRNKMDSRTSTPMFFRVISDRLSVLEAPDGSFDLSGQIAPDYSIFVDSIRVKLGSSEITGTYSQSWNPHIFRFLLKGDCLPTDINNWLGKWWKKIWHEFAFSEEIPNGDFSISGNWQKNIVNTGTHGIVKTKSLSFRNLSINQSRLIVYGDGNSTRIKASVDHAEGHLNGNLTIPRNLSSPDTPLSFRLKGDFPLNEGREVFGKEVKEILSDFNSSILACKAEGQIYRPQPGRSQENNKTHYEITISTDDNSSLWNIPVSYIHGTIKHSDSTTKGSFPSIGLGEGQASFDFETKSLPSNDSLSFKFQLQKADRYAIASIVNHFSFMDSNDRDYIKETVNTTKDSSGTLDLSLQAKGPLKDHLQFKGTGHLRLIDESLKKINLLGKISEKLGTSKLPIPSGSFSFEKLEIPFRIEYDKIYSDNILLTGPVSKLEASGQLNLISNEIDITAKLKLVGNLKIPLISQVINLADPLSKITEIKISGNWKNPKTELIVNPFK
jgi:hypothetical protein